jgi:hypothetical protein
MIIPGQFGFNCPSGFREEAFRNIFPIGSNVKLSPPVAAIFKMATTAGHRLTLAPMGKCSNAFFSETTNMIKAKLYMNVHWMVLYKPCVFCSHSWAVCFQLSKWFQRRSILKHFPHRVQCKIKSCRSRHFEFHIGTKNVN